FLSGLVGGVVEIGVGRGTVDPSENQLVPLVDADRAPSGQFSVEMFETVPWWRLEGVFLGGRVQNLQFSEQGTADRVPDPSVPRVVFIESLQPRIAEFDGHPGYLYYAQYHCASMQGTMSPHHRVLSRVSVRGWDGNATPSRARMVL